MDEEDWIYRSIMHTNSFVDRSIMLTTMFFNHMKIDEIRESLKIKSKK